jgi:predicted sugar kinase
MPESTGKSADGHAFALRLSVPAHGDLHEIAREIAAKVAEHLGAGDAQSLAAKVAQLAAQLRNGSPQAQDIAMEFRRVEGELVVEARCAGEASEVRHEIPA